MGARIPSLPLWPKEFDERIKYLEENGLPFTMKNIDPEFYNYIKQGQLFRFWGIIVTLIAVFAFIIVYFL